MGARKAHSIASYFAFGQHNQQSERCENRFPAEARADQGLKKDIININVAIGIMC